MFPFCLICLFSRQFHEKPAWRPWDETLHHQPDKSENFLGTLDK